MPTTHLSPSRPPLATLAAELARSSAVPAHALVGITTGWPASFVISRPLDNAKRAVLGFRAPTEWSAIASVFPIAGVRTVHLCTRSGGEVCIAIHEDGSLVTNVVADHLISDALRRAFALPTAPPLEPVALLDELIWLDQLVALAMNETLTEATASACRAPTGPSDNDPPWVLVHQRAIDSMSDDACRQLFEWMDPGMYARWMLRVWPDPAETVATLTDLVPEAVFAAIMNDCPQIRRRILIVGTESV